MAVYSASDKVIEKARSIAAHQMEVAETDLEFVDGQFRVVGTPAHVFSIQEAAFAAFTAHNLPEGLEPNLTPDASHDPTNFTFPFGAHIAVVELASETAL